MVATVSVQGSEGRLFSVYNVPAVSVQDSGGTLFSVYNAKAPSLQASEVRSFNLVTGTLPMQVSQAYVMDIVRGRPDNRRLRAWTFSLDGHDFYVIRLGESETLLYDLTAQKWVNWDSFGLPTWRAQTGTNWIGMQYPSYDAGAQTKVVVGDESLGLLWTLDPYTGTDQNPFPDRADVKFTRQLIGGVPMRLRDTHKVGAVYVTGSIGNPSPFGATIALRTSDDNGKTWTSHGMITASDTDVDQEFVWRSLGLIKAPGRIFELTDDGATCRIDGMDMR